VAGQVRWPSLDLVRFSIVIPTWKNLVYLDAAYRSLRAHSAVDHEIIVFFNDVDADSARWADDKDVQVLSDTTNVGVCAAVNRAVARASCDHVCFFNDDMIALPGWDTELARYLVPGAVQWLSGTAVEPGKATPCYIGDQDYGRSIETLDEAGVVAACDDLRRPYNIVSTWTPLLVRKVDWDAVGGFDEAYFPGYGSDPDLAMKFYRRGCRTFIGVGSSLVYHFSRRTISRFDTADVVDPKRLFQQKWGLRWRKFFRKQLFRDKLIGPEVLERTVQRGVADNATV
jgi:GT2 family glycosyltransferase